MQATHSLPPHTHPKRIHTNSATSHKVKSFSRVQRPSKSPQIYLNPWRPAHNERKDDFQSDTRSMCLHACVYHLMLSVLNTPSSVAHVPSVTQPPRRNPKLGRLVCTHNLWPPCSRSLTWHPLAAGVKRAVCRRGGALPAHPLSPDVGSSGGLTSTRC